MKGIYLCSRKHRIPAYDIMYNDIVNYAGIDFVCDALEVDLTPFDFIIATPPCNYYSRANYRREQSEVALMTKHLLPDLLEKCIKLGKPFIIENVLNSKLLPLPSECFMYTWGQHTFYTNILLTLPIKALEVKQKKQQVCRSKRDGNSNVDIVIKQFLEQVAN